MMRFLAALGLLGSSVLLLLPPIATGHAADLRLDPTVEPTPQSYEVQVVVETQGFRVPDDVVMETDFGNRTVYRHEILEPNHYVDYLKVRLETTMLWIFEHEGYGDRQDESWELFPAIAETPLTVTILMHNPVAPCQDPTVEHCNYVAGTGDKSVFMLDKNKNYHINLQVDYTRGVNDSPDGFTVTSTIR